MNPITIIKAKQNQSSLSYKDIDFIVSSYSNNRIDDELMTDFLIAVKEKWDEYGRNDLAYESNDSLR